MRWSGEAYKMLDKTSKAIEKFTTAKNIYSKPYDFFQLAELKNISGNVQEAVGLYKEYLRLTKGNKPVQMEELLNKAYTLKAEEYLSEHKIKGMRELEEGK